MNRQLWLELPPISQSAPQRLIVFLHGSGSSPEAFAPVAIAWQLKFPGAHAIIMQGPLPATAFAGATAYDWFAAGTADESTELRRARISEAAQQVTRRIRELQQTLGISVERTVLIGFSQGATVALESLRQPHSPARIAVAYAARLSRPVAPGEHINATVHLLHGALDTWVPLVHAQRAARGLAAAGARVTLDVVEDDAHSIGPEMIILGTTRVLQTLFKGRTPPMPIRLKPMPPTLH